MIGMKDELCSNYDNDVGYEIANSDSRSNRRGISESSGLSYVDNQGKIGQNITVISNLYYDEDAAVDSQRRNTGTRKISNPPQVLKKVENPYYEEEGISVAQDPALESPYPMQSSNTVKITQNIYYDIDNNSEFSNKTTASNVITRVENPYYE